MVDGQAVRIIVFILFLDNRHSLCVISMRLYIFCFETYVYNVRKYLTVTRTNRGYAIMEDHNNGVICGR